jgi:hypothetical protein
VAGGESGTLLGRQVPAGHVATVGEKGDGEDDEDSGGKRGWESEEWEWDSMEEKRRKEMEKMMKIESTNGGERVKNEIGWKRGREIEKVIGVKKDRKEAGSIWTRGRAVGRERIRERERL